MLFNWLKDRRRSKLAAETFPAAWLQIVHHNCRHFATLDSAEQSRLLRDIRWFLDEKSIETAIGLKLTDEMRVTVAAHASLLGLGFEGPPFDRLRSVIIRADSYVGTQIQRGSSGLELHSETARIGETTRNGPVLLSWRDVEQQCRDTPYGRNVILHEFAHLLDMIDGDVDGIPPLQSEEQYKTWKDVTRIEYHRLVNEAQFGIPSLLDWYGATNEAEFFAVATETFFEQPTELRKLHPRLYDVLRVFYKQDPANRWMRSVAEDELAIPGRFPLWCCMLTVKLFAKARDLVGSPVIQIPWSDGETVSHLKQALGERHPSLMPLVPRLLVAVNNDYASDTTRVSISDEVACFPPVSGG